MFDFAGAAKGSSCFADCIRYILYIWPRCLVECIELAIYVLCCLLCLGAEDGELGIRYRRSSWPIEEKLLNPLTLRLVL